MAQISAIDEIGKFPRFPTLKGGVSIRNSPVATTPIVFYVEKQGGDCGFKNKIGQFKKGQNTPKNVSLRWASLLGVCLYSVVYLCIHTRIYL